MAVFSNLSGCKSSGQEYTLVVENMRNHGWIDFLVQSNEVSLFTITDGPLFKLIDV